MKCPKCNCWALKVVETRKKEFLTINKRVLMCTDCLYVFSVTESIDDENIARKMLQDNETYQLFKLEKENIKKKK